MEKKKTYKVNEYEFRLKEDLTLNESELLQDIFKTMYSEDKTTVVANITGEQVKTLLKTVLEPLTELPSDFDYGNIKESVSLEVIKDFFANRIALAKNILNSSRNLTEKPQKR